MGMKYSIEHLVDMVEDGYAIDTPFFKGGWNFWPTTSSANIALASSSFEGGIPVFVVFRDSYKNTSARYPSGYYDIQTSGSATFELNVKPPNENLPVLINSDPTSNKYLYSRNNYNKGGVAPVNYIMGKSQYYISSSIGGFTGTLLETRIYSRQLTDSEVYRVCNAIRQNLQVSGSFR
jgi:hypothetical protein